MLSETGLAQVNYPNNQGEYLYWHCVAQFITLHRLGFGTWVYVGSYFYLHGQVNAPDSFGTLTPDFSAYAGPAFLKDLQKVVFDNTTVEQQSHNTVASI